MNCFMESDSGSTPRTSGTDTHPTSSFFRNRNSNASLLTLSSVRTFLPQYSASDALADPVNTASGGFPTYTPSQNAIAPPRYSLRKEAEFRYTYPIRPKSPWATLHLHTRDAVPGNLQPLQSQPKVPRFWSCDPIRGTLELDLDSPQNIQQISIQLNGSIVISSHSEGCLQFLGHNFTLWDKSMGDPGHGQSDGGDANRKQSDGRFAPGQYTFPFSFPFPTHADPITKSGIPNASSVSPVPSPEHQSPSTSSHPDVPARPEKKRRSSWTSRFIPSTASASGSRETASPKVDPPSRSPPPARHSLASFLPQSFMEKGINPNVAYEIMVCIDHGRFRASSRMKTKIAYFPASQPRPASQKRRDAYEAGALLPSPLDDPEGWLAWPTLTVNGVVISDEKRRETNAECTLYLAQPLSYTRGSVIPCFLTISSHDEELIHILSNSPEVRLLRRIRHLMGEVTNPTPDVYALVNTSWSHLTTLSTSETTLLSHEVGRARWWMPSKAVSQGSNTRHLEGEIHLSPSLPPSCDFQFFQIEYAIELLSFQTENFEPEGQPTSRGKSRKMDTVLASSPVEITTLYREDEPVPTAYSEPSQINMRRINSEGKRAVILEEDE